MTQEIILLGSTGSIGTQTLEICAYLGIRVRALTAGRNVALLEKQTRQFLPDLISVAREEDARLLRDRLSDLKPPVAVLSGRSGNLAAVRLPGKAMVVAAMVGVSGLEPVLAAITDGKSIALANKETLVAGGALVMPLIRKLAPDVALHPVDSEHSAIWQCLAGTPAGSLKRILLTASGGPFRGFSAAQLAQVSRDDALKHPTWQMGGKITIDSATLMNKGLEVIEASWLFDCPVDQIDVVIHPQSIIHSMIELTDGSVLAQMGFPDMKLPIQLALTWPERLAGRVRSFDPFDPAACSLTFEEPDRKNFRLLVLAYEAARIGGTMPAVMNAANEVAVSRFLSGSICFSEIASMIEKCMDHHLSHGFMTVFTFDDMMEQDYWARAEAGLFS